MRIIEEPAYPPAARRTLSYMLEQLADVFPVATGRDIKGLTKLVAKFCQQKQLTPDLEVFKRCSVFRGLEWADGDNR